MLSQKPSSFLGCYSTAFGSFFNNRCNIIALFVIFLIFAVLIVCRDIV